MSNCPSTNANKCCDIPVIPACPPCPPKETVKDKCEDKNKCPPMPTTDCSTCKPKWISCSPDTTKMYAVPEGVTILPISVGGRNGGQRGACGKCGQEKPSGKPKVSGNCPMMKAKCPGLESEKSPGLFAKLMSLFGKDMENDASSSAVTRSDAGRLESVCKSLQVEDEKIRHHRNVFNPELLVRKDGYMCPLLKKVDCVAADALAKFSHNFQAQCNDGKDNCSPPPQQNCGSPLPPPPSPPTGNCACSSPPPTPPPPPPPAPEVVPDCVDEEEEVLEEYEEDDCGNYEEEEDECVEDVEGECIIDNAEEQTAPECSPPPPPPPAEPECPVNCTTDKLDKDNSTCPKQNCSCVPMSNFVIRVQAPFSEGTSETCETIVDKLCKSRGAMYPEPAEDKPSSESDPECNNNLKVIEIKEEPLTFVCVNPAPSKPTPPPPPPPPKVTAQCPPLPPPAPCCNHTTSKPVEIAPPPPPPPACPESTPVPPKAEPAPIAPICETGAKSPEESRKLPPPPYPNFVETKKQCPENCRLVDPPGLAPVENKCTNTCIRCGKLKCECNQELKGHLKECAGLGVLPEVSPLLKKCQEIPRPPEPEKRAEESNNASNNDPWEYEAKPLCWDKKKNGSCGPSCNTCCDSSEDAKSCKQPCMPPPPPPVEEIQPEPQQQQQECPTPEPEPILTPCSEIPPPPPPPPTPEIPTVIEPPPMSATEMCRANIDSLMCTQCPSADYYEDSQGRREPPTWTSPPPPSCSHCGAATRGDTEDCAMCAFTRKARDPYRYDWICPTVIEYTPPEDPCFTKEEEKIPKCDSDEFDMTPEGTPIYEGGMCITRAQHFLWKTNPCENSLKRMGFENQCYEGFRRCLKNEEGVEEDCMCEPIYKGGMKVKVRGLNGVGGVGLESKSHRNGNQANFPHHPPLSEDDNDRY